MIPIFKGSYVALVTPFDSQGEIDYSALDRLVDFHLAHQTDGLVLSGTTGESPTLSEKEHAALISHVLNRVSRKIPVIAGVGKNDTRATVKLAQNTATLGVDGLLIVTPYYNKPTQEGLYRHYGQIAEKVNLPQLLYNVPGRTGCDLQPSTVHRLMSQYPQIAGVKETHSVQRIYDLIAECGPIPIYGGDDPNNLPMLQAGACGLISVTANVAPQQLHDLCVLVGQGRVDEAEKIHQQLRDLNKSLFLEANPIPVKWVLSEMGLIQQYLRLPLTSLSETHQASLREVLTNLNLLS